MQGYGMIAAIYCRADNADQVAVDGQKQKLRAYALDKGYDNVAVYIDNGYSGIRFERPAFIEMTKCIDAGIIGTVIVQNISRISRDSIGFRKWEADMRVRGVRFISVNDLHDSDKDDIMRDILSRIDSILG